MVGRGYLRRRITRTEGTVLEHSQGNGTILHNSESEVLTEVVMSGSVFWDIMTFGENQLMFLWNTLPSPSWL
jgi:hypothetical protein